MDEARRGRLAATAALGIAVAALVAACGTLGSTDGSGSGATSTSVSTVFRTIPISSTTTTTTTAAIQPGGTTGATNQALGKGETIYEVKAGDSYVRIARSHGTSYAALAAANGWDPNNPPVLFPGTKIRVPPSTTTTRPPVSTIAPGVIAIYTVQSGDSFNAIARKFGVQLTDLYNLNGINGQTVLHPGAKLKIPVPR